MKSIFLLLLVILTVMGASDLDEFQIEPKEALQFLFRARRSFLHPGKTKCEEQKREARKAYEDKCSFLGKRFCPKLSTWKDFQQWEIGNGLDRKRTPLPTKSTTPQMYTMRTHRTRLPTQPSLHPYNTPAYGRGTMRPIHRSSTYSDEVVTSNPFE